MKKFGKMPKEILNGFQIRMEEIKLKNTNYLENTQILWKIKQNSIKQIKMVEDIADDINLISNVFGTGSKADLLASAQKKNQITKKLKTLDNNKDVVKIDMYGFNTDTLPLKMISMGISSLKENLRKIKKLIGKYKGKNTPEFLTVIIVNIIFRMNLIQIAPVITLKLILSM